MEPLVFLGLTLILGASAPELSRHQEPEWKEGCVDYSRAESTPTESSNIYDFAAEEFRKYPIPGLDGLKLDGVFKIRLRSTDAELLMFSFYGYRGKLGGYILDSEGKIVQRLVLSGNHDSDLICIY